jgi:hypothetical protein
LPSTHRTQPQSAAPLAILQLKLQLVRAALFCFAFHHFLLAPVPRCEPGRLRFSFVLLKPEGRGRKKSPASVPLSKRKPNAGLVSLTMACFSYLLFVLTRRTYLPN